MGGVTAPASANTSASGAARKHVPELPPCYSIGISESPQVLAMRGNEPIRVLAHRVRRCMCIASAVSARRRAVE
eukprot:4195078-Prymnesium_polylepis.1